MVNFKILIGLSFLIIFSLNYSLNAYWEKIDLPETGVVQAVEVINSSTILTGIEGKGILFSTDLKNWAYPDQAPANKLIRDFHVEGSNIYTATNGGGIYFSGDNGLNWNEYNNSLDNNNALCLSSDKNGNLIAGMWFYGGVYKYDKSNEEWKRIGVKDNDVHAVYCTKSGDLYAGTHHNGTFYSSDNGESWTESGFFYNVTTYDFVEAADGRIVAAVSDGIYYTDDDGNSWKKSNKGLEIKSIRSLFACGDYIFAGTANGGIYRSSDNGINWTKLNANMPEPITILDMAADDNKRLYLATNMGLYHSMYPVDQSVLINHISPEDTTSADIGEPVSFTVTVSDETGNVIPGVEVKISNSMDSSSDTYTTDENGEAIINITVPDDISNGNYTISIETEKDGYAKGMNVEKVINVNHIIETYFHVSPEELQDMYWEQSREFEITLLDENQNPIPNTDLILNDPISNIDSSMTTDGSGKIHYTVIIPDSLEKGNYYIKIQFEQDGYQPAQGFISIRVLGYLSVTDDLTDGNIEIYPNPASDYLNISVPEFSEYEIKIIDMNSTIVFRDKNSEKIDLQSLPNGAYILIVTNRKSQFSTGFIVRR